MRKFVRRFFPVLLMLVFCGLRCHEEEPEVIRVSRYARDWVVSSGDCIYDVAGAGFPNDTYEDESGFLVSCSPAGAGLWKISGTRTVRQPLDKGIIRINTASMTVSFSALVSRAPLLGDQAFCASDFVVDYYEDNGLSARVVCDSRMNYPQESKPDGHFFVTVFDGGEAFEQFEIVLEGGSVIYENFDISR